MFFLPWCKKNQKNQARPEAPPAGQANAHEQSSKFVNTFFLRAEWLKRMLRVYLSLMKALSFSFAIFKNINALWKAKKKALAIFLNTDIITESFYRKYRGNKKTSTIVDVDDKNCLAELTVVLKLNHGVRQWLYIIAGALFFVTFFWANKRK